MRKKGQGFVRSVGLTGLWTRVYQNKRNGGGKVEWVIRVASIGNGQTLRLASAGLYLNA